MNYEEMMDEYEYEFDDVDETFYNPYTGADEYETEYIDELDW